mgnify:CR=1 FL=1
MKRNKSIFESMFFLKQNVKGNVEKSMQYDWNIFVKTIFAGFQTHQSYSSR